MQDTDNLSPEEEKKFLKLMDKFHASRDKIITKVMAYLNDDDVDRFIKNMIGPMVMGGETAAVMAWKLEQINKLVVFNSTAEANIMMCAFNWNKSEEGAEYWNEVCDKAFAKH